jgi:hypothetical protein
VEINLEFFLARRVLDQLLGMGKHSLSERAIVHCDRRRRVGQYIMIVDADE